MSSYADKVAQLQESWSSDKGHLRLQKSTISNLFRYEKRGSTVHEISLGDFNEIISLDQDTGLLEVEGLTTFEAIVSHTLPKGYLPQVAPELKHITIGGATVGIGIESTCFRFGFVHDSLVEADVVLPGGTVVTCTADNEHADLFHALPNSYGTLGYILRAKIKLHYAQPFTRLKMATFSDSQAYLDAMRDATESDAFDFVEGLFFEDRRFILMTGEMVSTLPRVDDILRKNVFYKLVQDRDEIRLRTEDYIFRYDPEWFWNLPESFGYDLFRRFAPKRFRNSSFYTKHVAAKEKQRERQGRTAEKVTETADPRLGSTMGSGRRAHRVLSCECRLERASMGRRPHKDAAQPDDLSNRRKRAVLQSWLLLPGRQACRQTGLLLHANHG